MGAQAHGGSLGDGEEHISVLFYSGRRKMNIFPYQVLFTLVWGLCPGGLTFQYFWAVLHVGWGHSCAPVKAFGQRVINLSGVWRQNLAEGHIASASLEGVVFKWNLRRWEGFFSKSWYGVFQHARVGRTKAAFVWSMANIIKHQSLKMIHIFKIRENSELSL